MSKSACEKKQPEINRSVCTTVFLLKTRKAAANSDSRRGKSPQESRGAQEQHPEWALAISKENTH